MRVGATGRHGFSTLQAVLLLGAAFLTTWGLMDVWKEVEDPLQSQTAKTLRREIGSITPNRGAVRSQPGGPTAGGDEPRFVQISHKPTGKKPAAEPDPETRLTDTAYALYFENRRFSRKELLDLKEFLENTNEVLDNPLSHLVLSEVNLRLGNHWEGFKELLAAVNPVDIILGRIRMAKQAAQAAKNGRNAMKAVDEAGDAARAGKKAISAATRRGFDSLDLEGRTTKEIREELENLAKANPGRVKRTVGKNGGDIWAIDLGDGTHGTIRIDPPIYKSGKKGERLMANMPHVHKEIVDNKVITMHGNTGYYPLGSEKERLSNAGKPIKIDKGDSEKVIDQKQRELHMPVRERGTFRWDEATRTWVPKD